MTVSRDELSAIRSQLIIFHYACSDFSESTVHISCICVKDYFQDTPIESYTINRNTEADLIKKFSEFLAANPGKKLIGWNINSPTYGFEVIRRRAEDLQIEMPECPPDCQLDLDKFLKKEYGRNYIKHKPNGQMLNLFKKNGFTIGNCLPGKEELDLFNQGDFRRIENSTICKVSALSNVVDLFLSDQLKIERGIIRFYYYFYEGLIEKLSENKLLKGILIIGGAIVILVQLYLWFIAPESKII